MYMSPPLSPTFNSLHAEGAQYIRTDSGRSAFMRTPLLESAQVPFGISLGYGTMARRLSQPLPHLYGDKRSLHQC